MVNLLIEHATTYRYHVPVELGPHRLILRPRESRDLRIIGSRLDITPLAETLHWAQDVAGNSIAMATFAGMTDSLTISCTTEVDLSAASWPVFDIAASAISYPFRYADEDWTDLGALVALQHPDPAGRLAAWARGFVKGPATDTLSLLRDLNAGVSAHLIYRTRDDHGTQMPGESLSRGQGSCRDFALLFAEAARSLGFGARLGSGYLFDPVQELVGSDGAGSTHAWAEIFVPGAGWIAYDPTNRSIGGANLVPVAVVRDLGQAVPVSGSFAADRSRFDAMEVAVKVTQV